MTTGRPHTAGSAAATEARLLAVAASLGDGASLGRLVAAAKVRKSTAQSAVARLRGRGEWPHRWPRRGPSELAAETDARVLAAAGSLAERPGVCMADLARAAGVDPVTAGKSVARIREGGGHDFAFLVSGAGRNGGRRRAARGGRPIRGEMVRVPSPRPGAAAPAAYLHPAGRRGPVDMGEARDFCEDILAVWHGDPWDRLEVAGLVGVAARSLSGPQAEEAES